MKTNNRLSDSFRVGFTLVEMSIILLIIALLAGGILLGRDLIENAEIQATAAQINSFDAAVGTFRNKYNCLPGDCPHALDYGLGEATCPDPYPWVAPQTILHAGCNGNGNGLLDDNEEDNWPIYCPECLGFWYHLQKANLVAIEHMDGKTASPLLPNFTPKFGISAPYSKISGQAFMTQSYVKFSYYLLGWREDTTDRLSDRFTLKAKTAYRLDVKLDDGGISSGRVLGSGTTCVKIVPPGNYEYKLNDPNARCGLDIRIIGYGSR